MAALLMLLSAITIGCVTPITSAKLTAEEDPALDRAYMLPLEDYPQIEPQYSYCESGGAWVDVYERPGVSYEMFRLIYRDGTIRPASCEPETDTSVTLNPRG